MSERWLDILTMPPGQCRISRYATSAPHQLRSPVSITSHLAGTQAEGSVSPHRRPAVEMPDQMQHGPDLVRRLPWCERKSSATEGMVEPMIYRYMTWTRDSGRHFPSAEGSVPTPKKPWYLVCEKAMSWIQSVDTANELCPILSPRAHCDGDGPDDAHPPRGANGKRVFPPSRGAIQVKHAGHVSECKQKSEIT